VEVWKRGTPSQHRQTPAPGSRLAWRQARGRCAATALMLPLRLRRTATTPRFRYSASARTRMTSRSVAAARAPARATCPRRNSRGGVSGDARRAEEARCRQRRFVGRYGPPWLVKEFRDGFFPYIGAGIKDFFETLKLEDAPDVISHITGRPASRPPSRFRLTWNTFETT